MTFTVREANSDADWQRGCAVLHRVYVGEGYTEAELAARMQNRERLEHEGAFLIAQRGMGEVIGAVLFLHAESALKQVARRGEREFRMLAVHPEARGEGVGEALVRACIDRTRTAGGTALVLWTQPMMHAAHRLYERLGFIRAPHRDQADPRGFTRLVYQRPCSATRGVR